MATNPNLTYGKVTGFYSRVFVDGTDADAQPETMPIAGLQITFTPSVQVLVNKTAKATIQITTFPATTDEDGNLCTMAGDVGIELPATIDPLINETGWTWTVTIQGAVGGYPREQYAFTLTSGQEVDLSTVVKLPSSLGTQIVQWEAAVAATYEYALEAGASVEEARALIAAMPDVPTTPAEVGAEPVGLSAATIEALAIPSSADEVGAEPAGLSTATKAAQAATIASLAAPKVTSAGAFGAVVAALESGNSAAIGLAGDSTGNAPDEWFILTADRLAAPYPSVRCMVQTWDDVNDKPGPWVARQAGLLGERHALIPATGRTLSLPSAYAVQTSPDLDIRVKVSLDSWSTGVTQTLISRFGSAGQRSWKLVINPAGTRVQLDWSSDGSNLLSVGPPPNMPAFAPGETKWIRATLDADNGAAGHTVTTYISDDGETWTTLGASTVAGVTSVFNGSTVAYELGGRSVISERSSGKFYRAEVRDGIGGPIINPQPIDTWVPTLTLTTGSVLSTFGGSPTLYVVNASKPGGNLAYLADPVRMKRMFAPFPQMLTFLSCSHNDYELVGQALTTQWDAYLAALQARLPGGEFVIVTQNPEIAPIEAPQIANHSRRRRELLAWASRQRLYAIDTYAAFVADSRGIPALLALDGIHPNAAGSAVWSDAVMKVFTGRE